MVMTTPITDLSKLPLVLTLDEVAGIYRRAKSTIRSELQKKTFRPAPTWTFPYRWLREDIERDLKRRSIERDNSRRGGRRRSA
jgi:hypothetical protein